MKPKRNYPSLDLIRELFDYDPETGIFVTKVKRAQVPAGTVQGSPTKKGYLRVWIEGGHWYLHQLAWAIMTGEWVDEIDHRDTNNAHNAFTNLRPASRSHNNANWKLSSKNRYGMKGVTFVERLPRPWVAHIMFKKKGHYLGCFSTKEQAHEAYMQKSREFHGDFARGA